MNDVKERLSALEAKNAELEEKIRQAESDARSACMMVTALVRALDCKIQNGEELKEKRMSITKEELMELKNNMALAHQSACEIRGWILGQYPAMFEVPEFLQPTFRYHAIEYTKAHTQSVILLARLFGKVD